MIKTAIGLRDQAHFDDVMSILRKTAAYTELRKVVTLPAARETAATGGAPGWRRIANHG